ncbi:hypothetical protein GOBAR_AA09481 [Gossypium barbadense]|uniref:CCHC-type domain-containing protein n=1 Tax=Gossypium barbadense TaxID=3634 RepID=A0A2P5Y6G3_GOSBA|nr:hypothetical protein GOBAR_AA09481 [Gossypium barbadense]
MAWIRLPGLMRLLYNRKTLEEIGNFIGRLVKLNYNTNSRSRGRFAQMAVYVNLDKPLIPQILVNGTVQRVQYEALPLICFGCGRYGHIKALCPHFVDNLDHPMEKGGGVGCELGKGYLGLKGRGSGYKGVFVQSGRTEPSGVMVVISKLLAILEFLN